MNQTIENIKQNIAKVMVGKEEVVDLLLTALVAGGHVLLEDVPGMGKTVLAKTFAKSMNMKFTRVQFTPDLLPSDITGLSYYHQQKGEFELKEGPVFTNLLLADEINRATPRTQASLLECMGEGQVTIDGETRPLAKPFFVLATQNPVETFGCFPLPEAQLDRFLMKISMGSMTKEEERQMIDRFLVEEPLLQLEAVCKVEEVLQLQNEAKTVFIHNDMKNYIVELMLASRKESNHRLVAMKEGISPRGTLALVKAAQGYAMIKGRDFVTPEDIKALAIPVLAHRLICEEGDDQVKIQKIQELLQRVEVPTEDFRRA